MDSSATTTTTTTTMTILHSKKERNRRENAALFVEAKRSEVDPVTGRVRCLSCGSAFASLSALAAHLRKHNGVNAINCKPAKVVGTTERVYGNRPVQRPPEILLGHLIPSVIQSKPKPVAGPSNKKARHHEQCIDRKREKETQSMFRYGWGCVWMCCGCLDDGMKKKNKLTPMKRSILIHQVLSLTHALQRLHQEINVLNERQKNGLAASATVEMKREGCINATSTELQMALTVINRRFTVRQLVMIEYLTSQMGLLASSTAEQSSEIKNPLESDIDEDLSDIRMSQLTKEMVTLYTEAEMLGNAIEVIREAEWNRRENSEFMRLEETRRDADTGKIFIKRPAFAQSPPKRAPSKNASDHAEQISDLSAGASNVAAINQAPVSDGAGNDDEDVVDLDDSLASTQETSSNDDDMWGFSDVLAQWARQTQNNTRMPVCASYSCFDTEDGPSSHPIAVSGKTTQSSDDYHGDSSSSDAGIRILYSKKTMNGAVGEDIGSSGQGSEVVWQCESGIGETGGQQHMFIRSSLVHDQRGRSEDPTVQFLKDMMSKKKPVHPPPAVEQGRPHARLKQGDSTVNETEGRGQAATLDSSVHSLLCSLNSLQHARMKSSRGQTCPKLIVSGFAEVTKHLTRGSVKLIIVANNLDISIHSKISELQVLAEEHEIPFVRSLTRKKIGKIYHVCKRMSVVAVLDYQGLEDAFATVIRLSQDPPSHASFALLELSAEQEPMK